MLLLKYHKATPPDLDHSAVDLKSETFTVEITDSDGNTTSEERPVFHSVSAHVKLVDLMTYPYGAVTDDAKREQLTYTSWSRFLKPERDAWHSQSFSFRSLWRELGPHRAHR